MKHSSDSGFFNAVYDVVRRIPKGKVTTYGAVARTAGNPRASRAVGWALHVNPDPAHIPCHRVVNKDGEMAKSFAFGGADEQRARLALDGVEFDETGRVQSKYFISEL